MSCILQPAHVYSKQTKQDPPSCRLKRRKCHSCSIFYLVTTFPSYTELQHKVMVSELKARIPFFHRPFLATRICEQISLRCISRTNTLTSEFHPRYPSKKIHQHAIMMRRCGIKMCKYLHFDFQVPQLVAFSWSHHRHLH